MNDRTNMDSIADVQLIIEASDQRGVVRRATFTATAASNTGSGFRTATALRQAVSEQARRELDKADGGYASAFDEPPAATPREDEPEPTPVEPDGYGVDGLELPGPTGTITFPFAGRQVTGMFIERGRWYPDLPPGLPGETDEQYTNRLTGYSGRALVPYDHRRNRQCSLGYHDECSDRASSAAERHCECPCHSDAETIAAAAQRLGAASRGGAAGPGANDRATGPVEVIDELAGLGSLN